MGKVLKVLRHVQVRAGSWETALEQFNTTGLSRVDQPEGS